MKEALLMEEAELIEKAVRILMRHLGPVEAARFLSLCPSKRMESVKRHRRWQSKLRKNAFFDQVFASKQPNHSGPAG